MGGRAGGGAAGGMGRASRGGSWPTLTGSEKQVSWANDIRSGAQKALDTIKGLPMKPAGKAVVAKWEQTMKGMTSAKQWIDARYNAPKGYDDKAYNASNVKVYIQDFDSWLGH